MSNHARQGKHRQTLLFKRMHQAKPNARDRKGWICVLCRKVNYAERSKCSNCDFQRK